MDRSENSDNNNNNNHIPPTFWQNVQQAYVQTKKQGKLLHTAATLIGVIALPIFVALAFKKLNADILKSYQFEANRAIPLADVMANPKQYRFTTILHSQIFGNGEEFAYKWILPVTSQTIGFSLSALTGLCVVMDSAFFKNYQNAAKRN